MQSFSQELHRQFKVVNDEMIPINNVTVVLFKNSPPQIFGPFASAVDHLGWKIVKYAQWTPLLSFRLAI